MNLTRRRGDAENHGRKFTAEGADELRIHGITRLGRELNSGLISAISASPRLRVKCGPAPEPLP